MNPKGHVQDLCMKEGILYIKLCIIPLTAYESHTAVRTSHYEEWYIYLMYEIIIDEADMEMQGWKTFIIIYVSLRQTKLWSKDNEEVLVVACNYFRPHSKICIEPCNPHRTLMDFQPRRGNYRALLIPRLLYSPFFSSFKMISILKK